MVKNIINTYKTMWKHVSDLKGTTSSREFWLACVGHILAMYILLIPMAVIMMLANAMGTYDMIVPILLAASFALFLLPIIPMLIRRANDAGIRLWKAVLLFLGIPGFGFVLLGILQKKPEGASDHILTRIGIWLICIGLGMSLWGMVVLMLTESAILPMIGLVCFGVGIMIGYIGVELKKREEMRAR